MNVLVLYAIIFLAGSISGGTIIHWKESSERLVLEKAIEKQKTDAADLLLSETVKVEASKERQQQLNDSLEKAHAQNISTINALNDELSSIRLRKFSGKSCSSTERKGNNSSEPSGETYSDELAAGLHQFLTGKAFNSGRIDSYAEECYKFVVEQNCGISK